MIFFQESKDVKHEGARLEGVLHAVKNKTLLTLVVEPSVTCNLACTFCDMHANAQANAGRNKGMMSETTFRRIVDQLSSHSIRLKQLQYHGNGEPTLNRHLPAFVAYARERAVADIHRLTSNGTCLTPTVLRTLVDSGINEIHVSLDVADRDQYRLLKGKDLFVKLEKNLTEAMDYAEQSQRFSLVIKCVVPLQEALYGFTQQEMMGVVEKYRLRAEHSRYVHIKSMPVFVNQMDGLQRQVANHAPCELPFFSLFIKHDGVVAACCGDVKDHLTIGHIHQQSLAEILDSEALRHIRLCHLQNRLSELPICLYCGNRFTDISKIADALLDYIV